MTAGHACLSDATTHHSKCPTLIQAHCTTVYTTNRSTDKDSIIAHVLYILT